MTKKLTKIINIPVFKNTGNAISMATKNIGYGAVCNTNRLHGPLFLDVCVEVPAFAPVRDKMVLNITDGAPGPVRRGARDRTPSSPTSTPRSTSPPTRSPLTWSATPLLVNKRKSMGVTVNENPRFTEYLRYAEKLGMGTPISQTPSSSTKLGMSGDFSASSFFWRLAASRRPPRCPAG